MFIRNAPANYHNIGKYNESEYRISKLPCRISGVIVVACLLCLLLGCNVRVVSRKTGVRAGDIAVFRVSALLVSFPKPRNVSLFVFFSLECTKYKQKYHQPYTFICFIIKYPSGI